MPPIEAGVHIAVCSMLVDLGVQVSEQYGQSKQVLIGWEIPDCTYNTDDGPKPRNISRYYTASLNERARLRHDLAAWRGRDFTGEELEAFNLRNILGKPCQINIVNKEVNGKTRSAVTAVMALPKGMAKPKPVEPPVVFDMDEDPVSKVGELPDWIAEIIKRSPSYKEKLAAESSSKADPFSELDEFDDGDGELPF